ncbi:MAG: hypothetical protein RL177_1522, partial [Bacteroidota bacterium]
MKPLLTLAFILSLATATVQAQAIGYSLEQLNLNSSANQIVPYSFDYGILQGHPYHHPQWVNGSFRTSSSMVFTDVPMKYDSYSGFLAIRMDADSVFMKPAMVTEFQYSIGGQPYLFKNGFFEYDLGVKPEAYFLVLSEGTYTVLKDVAKVYRKANYDAVFNTGSKFDRLLETPRYLVKKPDGTFVTVLPNRRSVLPLFGANRGKV